MRRLGRAGGKDTPAPRFDDNLTSYDVQRDGRSGEGRVQHVRLDRVEPSPFQVRRIFPEREIEELAESIRLNGLIHQPKGRPYPGRPGWIELMPGEMRVRALQRLIERGEAEEILRRDAEGAWLIPVQVEEVDDERAEAIVFAENDDRTDLSAWEWALAWRARRESRVRRGQPATVREVAASHGKKYQTVGEYLQVADAITQEVLLAAGVVSGGEPDHARMGRLSLAALQRVARATQQGGDAAATRLLQELKGTGDHTAGGELERRRKRVESQPRRSTFQINIRTALLELSPSQAVHYLTRMAPAVGTLAERAAAEVDPHQAGELADALEAAAARLRSRGA